MKKTVFLALMVCGLVASFFVGTLMSQERVQSFRRGQQIDLPGQQIIRLPRRNLVLIDDISPQIESLRNQLLELTQRRIKAMKEEELKAEMARLQEQLTEEQAEKKLQQANKILREIVKEYPESQAAKRAGAMLKVAIGGYGRSRGSGLYRGGRRGRTPDDEEDDDERGR